jgi:RimJ/RimL family protein N-acetyltransferase
MMSPNLLRQLATPRLRLRPVTDADTDTLWALWSEPDVRRFKLDDAAIVRNDAAGAIARYVESGASGLGLWIILDAGDSRLMGCVGLAPVSAARFRPDATGRIEVLIALSRSAWGLGYATEALTAMMDYAFDVLALPHLTATVDVPNQASHRLMARVGFAADGETEGPKLRLRWYVIARDEWRRRRGR